MRDLNNHVPSTISVVDTHTRYDVTFYSHTIHTLLTTDPSMVDTWISDTLRTNHNRNLIVGLDTEWRPNCRLNPNNPVATLQLCVGLRCLVFQILRAPFVPRALASFLANRQHTFVGVKIEEDVKKLREHHGLGVSNIVDLRNLAVDKLGEQELRKAGLKTLAMRVLGMELEKPEWITMSSWDNLRFTAEQARYACLDAFVSFEVGRILLDRDLKKSSDLSFVSVFLNLLAFSFSVFLLWIFSDKNK